VSRSPAGAADISWPGWTATASRTETSVRAFRSATPALPTTWCARSRCRALVGMTAAWWACA